MKSMRKSWTDSRLDDFAAQTDRRFDAVDQRFDDLERRMDAGFNRIDTDIREMRGEIGALQRTILQVGSGVGGAMAVGVLGLLATQL